MSVCVLESGVFAQTQLNPKRNTHTQLDTITKKHFVHASH